MSRITLTNVILVAVLTVATSQAAHAQYRLVSGQPAPFPGASSAIQPIRNAAPLPMQRIRYAAPAGGQNGNGMPTMNVGPVRPHYPNLHAPLNPTPRPNIPYQVGGTLITNQAFAPHEMLYPHTYKAMYPPFYYKVRGGWLGTPWGVWTRERWKLQGTVVKVKYRSKFRLFSNFTPPFNR